MRRPCRAIAEHTEADLNSALTEYRKGQGQPGGVTRAGYALWTLELTGWKADETTAAVGHYLATASSKRDHMAVSSARPPSESSNFTATALALRGLARLVLRNRASRETTAPRRKVSIKPHERLTSPGASGPSRGSYKQSRATPKIGSSGSGA